MMQIDCYVITEEVNNLYSRDFNHILVFELLLFLKAVLWYTDTLKFRTVASQWKWKLVGVNSEYTKAIGYFSANGAFSLTWPEAMLTF